MDERSFRHHAVLLCLAGCASDYTDLPTSQRFEEHSHGHP